MPVPLALSLPLTIIGTLVLASVFEGMLHQFVLHTGQKKILFGWLYGAYHAHAIEHHPAYRGDEYHQPAPVDEQKISLGWYTLPLTLLATSPITAAVWLTLGQVCGIAVLVTISLYYVFYEFLHWHMHFPKKDGTPRWYHKYPPLKNLFDWFDKRHYVHHMIDDTNFNVVLPVYDLIVGRYTTNEERVPWALRRRKRRAMARSARLRTEHSRRKTTRVR